MAAGGTGKHTTTRFNVLLTPEQISKARAVADDLGRRGVRVPVASVLRAAIDAGLPRVEAAYGVGAR